ncbi:MAG: hypothetical protein IJV01_00375 [Bacteroidales bacterium]|nr:hypothetical protein [Bacteroidales bacterium]
MFFQDGVDGVLLPVEKVGLFFREEPAASDCGQAVRFLPLDIVFAAFGGQVLRLEDDVQERDVDAAALCIPGRGDELGENCQAAGLDGGLDGGVAEGSFSVFMTESREAVPGDVWVVVLDAGLYEVQDGRLDVIVACLVQDFIGFVD